MHDAAKHLITRGHKMPSQMSLMGRIIFPDGYVSSPFCCLQVAFYSGDGSDLPHALVLCHHSLCSTPRHFPVPVKARKCLSALANFDKCNIRLKVIQLHMDNLSKIEANTSLWVCYRKKTPRLKLLTFLKHSVVDLVWK